VWPWLPERVVVVHIPCVLMRISNPPNFPIVSLINEGHYDLTIVFQCGRARTRLRGQIKTATAVHRPSDISFLAKETCYYRRRKRVLGIPQYLHGSRARRVCHKSLGRPKRFGPCSAEASMQFARAQRAAANHDGSIADLNARPRITRAVSLRTGRGGVTKLLLDRRMNQKQCATPQPKPMGPGRNGPLTHALTATAKCHAGAHGSSSAASTACATMCESLPAIRGPSDHSQSHSVAVVARLTVKRRSDLALRRVPKRRARNAPPNHRPPQSTSRKKTWSSSRRKTWSTSRKKSSIRP
jgi:hypothetical protein